MSRDGEKVRVTWLLLLRSCVPGIGYLLKVTLSVMCAISLNRYAVIDRRSGRRVHPVLPDGRRIRYDRFAPTNTCRLILFDTAPTNKRASFVRNDFIRGILAKERERTERDRKGTGGVDARSRDEAKLLFSGERRPRRVPGNWGEGFVYQRSRKITKRNQ